MRREQSPLGLTTRDKPLKLGIITPRVFFYPHSELSPRPRSCPLGEENAAYTDTDVKKSVSEHRRLTDEFVVLSEGKERRGGDAAVSCFASSINNDIFHRRRH
ncbi:hypothetical protein INR49_001499 [Caranx melampygus]|nr:hypothetical protein INR49_001499 [Caranx melampygus]